MRFSLEKLTNFRLGHGFKFANCYQRLALQADDSHGGFRRFATSRTCLPWNTLSRRVFCSSFSGLSIPDSMKIRVLSTCADEMTWLSMVSRAESVNESGAARCGTFPWQFQKIPGQAATSGYQKASCGCLKSIGVCRCALLSRGCRVSCNPGFDSRCK